MDRIERIRFQIACLGLPEKQMEGMRKLKEICAAADQYFNRTTEVFDCDPAPVFVDLSKETIEPKEAAVVGSVFSFYDVIDQQKRCRLLGIAAWRINLV